MILKLNEYCRKMGISYITGYRWFKNNKMPIDTNSYQTDTGTIFVEVDDMQFSEQPVVAKETATNDAMSFFLKKTVEFSKNNSTLEDFAAFIVSNFQLKLNNISDNPKYSRNKPKAEEVQKHFQQFLPDPKNVEHLKVVKTLLKEGKPVDNIVPADLFPASFNGLDDLSTNKIFDQCLATTEQNACFSSSDPLSYSGVGASTIGGLATNSVDINSTPQSINYTGSSSQPSNSFFAMATPDVPVNSLPKKRGRKPKKA